MAFKREPALWLGLINAILALLLAFGVNLTQVQVGTILAVTNAVFALITRQVVTANANLEK